MDAPAPKKKRRWLRWTLYGFGGFFLCLAGFVTWALLFCFADPPELDYTPQARAWGEAEADGARMRLGPNWFQARKGRSLLYLEGDPYSIGYANGKLTNLFLREQEEALMGTIRKFFPGTLSFYGIAVVVLVNNRNLPDFVPREYQEEILGLSEGSDDPFPQYGPRYHRILNYHAAHDIGHWVQDRPVIGCTAFAAVGKATRSGALLVGRNFDFEAGRHFDVNKIIGCYVPQKGYAFLSVSWPGMAGAITGINSERIYCSMNGAHSSDKDNIGTPVSLVVRQVLQYAGSLEEAIETIRAARVFVADSYLVADGKTGAAAVVEKSPGRTAVRRMGAGPLMQANHFECPEFADDEGNREYMTEGSARKRRTRLGELVKRYSGRLDPARIVEILRDRSGVGDVALAPGNRGAINPCIATHSVVCDVTRGILWVSRGPHQLGAYDPYSIARFGEPVGPTIPAAALLVNGGYDKLVEARRLIALGDEASLRQALELNPGDCEALFDLAQLVEPRDRAEARELYRLALAAGPPFAGMRRRIEERIKALEG